MDIYRQKILDHYRHPRNFGSLAKATHTAHVDNPLCGDEVTLRLRVRAGKVTGVAFAGTGCAISTAATSLLTDALAGVTLAQARRLSADSVLTLLGVPISPARRKCALLGWTALRTALGQPIDPDPAIA